MKRIVVDTNVLVSGLLVPGSRPAQVLQEFRDGQWSLVVSGAILEEYGRVLRRRRFGLSLTGVESILSEIESRSLKVIPAQRFEAVPEDPTDNEFLDVAVEAEADCIVSGDRHLLDLRFFRTIPIMNPADFLSRFD